MVTRRGPPLAYRRLRVREGRPAKPSPSPPTSATSGGARPTEGRIDAVLAGTACFASLPKDAGWGGQARRRALAASARPTATIVPMDFPVRDHNRAAWNRLVDSSNEWTVPVSPEAIAAARRGNWEVLLTPTRAVPHAWFGALAGLRLLCLASGGGQQGPILAAAGAQVVVFDNSPRQLDQDRFVARRDGLDLATVEGDMRDLSAFGDGSFDLVFHPVSNLFVPEVRPVWREAHRVLRPGGRLLAGFVNPLQYIFDWARSEKGELVVRHTVPYSDLSSLAEEERRHWIAAGEPLEFGHTLEDQIGGQLEAGLALIGFYEDVDPKHVLSHYIASFIATLAFRPR